MKNLVLILMYNHKVYYIYIIGITNVCINSAGNKLCAVNSTGYLWLWNLYYNRSIDVINVLIYNIRHFQKNLMILNI